MASRLRAFRAEGPSLADEPRYYARVPQDLYEDPRLSPRVRDVFGQLLKCHRSTDRVLYMTQAALAAEARCSIRTVRAALQRLEDCGYLRRDREYGRGGRTAIHLCYELRPSLRLEPDAPIATGTRGKAKARCNRQPVAACNRQKPAACNRQPVASPSLFEQREDRETTTSESSGSDRGAQTEPPSRPLESPQDAAPAPAPPIPRPGADAPQIAAQAPESMAATLAMAVGRWPELAAELPGRVADLVAKAQADTGFGAEGAALALEYACRIPGAKGPGLAFGFLTKWWADGLSLEDARQLVQCRRALDAPPAAGARPESRFHRRAEPAEADPEERRKVAELLAEWRTKGIARAPAGERKPAAGSVAKPSPRPAGATCFSPRNLTVIECSRQEKSAKTGIR